MKKLSASFRGGGPAAPGAKQHPDSINHHDIHTLISHVLAADARDPSRDELFRLAQYSNESFSYRLTILTAIFDRTAECYEQSKKRGPAARALLKNVAAEKKNDLRVVLKALVALQFLLLQAPDGDKMADSLRAFDAHYGHLVHNVGAAGVLDAQNLDFETGQLIKKKSLDLLELLDTPDAASGSAGGVGAGSAEASSDVSSTGSVGGLLESELSDYQDPKYARYEAKKPISEDHVTNTPLHKPSRFAAFKELGRRGGSSTRLPDEGAASNNNTSAHFTDSLKKTAGSLRSRTSSLTASSSSLLAKGQSRWTRNNNSGHLLGSRSPSPEKGDTASENNTGNNSGRQSPGTTRTRPSRGKSLSSLSTTITSKLHRSNNKAPILEKEMLSGKKYYTNYKDSDDEASDVDSENPYRRAPPPPPPQQDLSPRRFRSNSQPVVYRRGQPHELKTQAIPVNFSLPSSSNNSSSYSLNNAAHKNPELHGPTVGPATDEKTRPPQSSPGAKNNPFLSPLLENTKLAGGFEPQGTGSSWRFDGGIARHTDNDDTGMRSPALGQLSTNPFLSPQLSESRISNNATGNPYINSSFF